MKRTAADLQNLASIRAMCRDGRAQQIRLDNQLAQIEIAAACDTSHQAVSLWERGIRSPRGDAGLRYARLILALDKRQAVAS